MSLDINKIIDQLQDSDVEIIKLANTEINNADLSGLDSDDLELLKKNINPILENDNLTARFFAKKNLKRIKDILNPAETADKTAIAEQAFGIKPVDSKQKSEHLSVESTEHPTNLIETSTNDAESTHSDIAESTHSDIIEEPAAKPIVVASQAPLEIAEKKPEKTTPVKIKKPGKKIISGKKSIPVEGSWFPGLVAILNILFFLGITFDFSHDSFVKADAVKVLTSDLMTQIVFGSMIFFGLSNLFLRKSMNLYGSGRLALIFSTSIIGFSYFYPAIYNVTDLNTFKILNFNPATTMFWAIGMIYLYSVASIWEGKNKFVKIKSAFTILALFPLAGFIISGLQKPLYSIYYKDPYLLDSITYFSSLPYYLKPIFMGLNIIIPLISAYLILALLGNIFTFKIKKSISIILILFLNTGLLYFTFNSYSTVMSDKIALNDVLAISWNKVYTLSKNDAFKPKAWLVSTLSKKQIKEWNMEGLLEQKTKIEDPDKIEKNKKQDSKYNTDNSEGNINNSAETMPKSDGSSLNKKTDSQAKPVKIDVSIIEKDALKKRKFKTKNEIFEHLDKMIAAWLYDNDNMVSKDSLKTFEQRVLNELTTPVNEIFKDKKTREDLFSQVGQLFNEKRQKLFPEKVQINNGVKDEKARCFLNIQKISAAVESYNFSQESEEKFMKKLDFNLLYPKYLPAGIPECPSHGKYSLTSDGGRSIVTCSKHGAPILED